MIRKLRMINSYPPVTFGRRSLLAK